MEWWLATAMDLAQERAPLLTDEHANDLADNLYRAWPDDTPAVAVDKFFRIVGPTWKPLSSSTVH
jgi:hypothetical protein